MAARLAGRFWQRRLNRSTPWGQCRPHAPREEPHAEREVYTVPIAGTYLGRKELASGGVVIAFVGPDAAGKSTLVRETAQWLGTTLAVTPAHLGKPPSAWLTWLPNILGRGLRWALRRRRTSAGPTGSGSGRPGLWRSLRAVLLAWDRRALALKLRRVAAGGRVVLCDRYPSALVGAMDSARLPLTDAPSGWFNLRTRFARLENRLYREIPPPDIVIRLVVPVEVALERNRLRQIPDKDHETDAYVRHRHTAVPVPRFPSARTIDLDMTQPRRAVAQVLQQTLWRLL